MQTVQRFAAGLAFFALVGVGCPSEPAVVLPQDVQLTHVASYALPAGTQRPEVVVSDAGDAYVAVIEPAADPTDSSRRVVHRVYRYEGADFSKTPTVFPVTYVTDEFGSPSDHRLLIADGTLAIVYQSKTEADGLVTSQSLMLATYAFDGTELFRRPIFANASAGSGENFTDLSAAWREGWLYVATGTGEGRMNIRMLNLDGSIMSTHTVAAGPAKEILSETGNGLVVDAGGNLTVVSGNAPGTTDSLRLTAIDSIWDITGSTQLPSSGREDALPTGVTRYGDFLLVGYSSRATGGEPDVLQNPYAPYLKVLDADGTVRADERVGTSGETRVHPTVAVLGNRAFVAWSASVAGADGQIAPQVQIEEFSL